MLKINKNLFWDVDFKGLDYTKKMIALLLSVFCCLGTKKDYNILKKNYSYEKIKKTASEISYPDKKNANFWNFIFNLSNDKKYANRLSMQKQSTFWNR